MHGGSPTRESVSPDEQSRWWSLHRRSPCPTWWSARGRSRCASSHGGIASSHSAAPTRRCGSDSVE